MAIYHLLKDYNPNDTNGWDLDFELKELILKSKTQQPEVLILGTFNPALESNQAEIFYGRNYFWPAFENLSRNELVLQSRRDAHPQRFPEISRIFELMGQFKMAFSDLLLGILQDESYDLIIENNKEKIRWNGTTYNPIDDSDLSHLSRLDQCSWNTEHIIQFLRSTPSIKHVYFTRSATGCWDSQIAAINNACPEVKVQSIYTPSAQGAALHDQTGIKGRGKMVPLLHHWLFTEADNNGHMDHEWLAACGVDLLHWKNIIDN